MRISIDEEVEEDVGEMDELKQKRKQQLERASHAKYRFENYPGIAKEAWLAEYASQVQDMLTCSLELIPRSPMYPSRLLKMVRAVSLCGGSRFMSERGMGSSEHVSMSCTCVAYSANHACLAIPG